MELKDLHSTFFNTDGGIDILISHLATLKIWPHIDAMIGKRHGRAEYSNSDLIQSWIMSMLCGAKKLEHTNKHREKFKNHPAIQKGASTDTIGKILKSLAAENTYYTKSTYSRNKDLSFQHTEVFNPTSEEKKLLHEVNVNLLLNKVLFDVVFLLGLIKYGEECVLDIDATFIPNEVSDSRASYNDHGRGYFPMVVMLAGIPIFLEMRNGNSSPAFRQLEVLKMAIDLAKSKGIKIKLVRIDAAGSNKKIVNFLNDNKIDFVIRATKRYKKHTLLPQDWVKTPGQNFKFTNTTAIIMNGIGLRVIEYLSLKKVDKQTNKPKEYGILTSLDYPQEAILDLYNARSKEEKNFSALKSMGWKYMIHRQLKHNTVHLLITMLANIIFIYAKKWLSGIVPFVKETFQLGTFIYKFIQVITVWINGKLCFINRKEEFEAFTETS